MSTGQPRITIGVDIGGTFTDLFLFDEASGEVHIAKLPSSRDDPSRGFLQGLQTLSADLASVAAIVHGTTVATNALLERKVARTGVITTRGFRDVLEMRRRDRPSTWGLTGRFDPLVQRRDRREVDERVLADGRVLQAVDAAQVRAAAAALAADGCEALCVFFINSHANPENEQAALLAAAEVWPNSQLSASHQILPEVREFERASTASINAALQPVVSRYLGRLSEALQAGGFAGRLLIVQSNGGVMTVDTARRMPARTALSGPAAGVIACRHIAASAGFPNVITGDVGGTSFDVSLIAEGQLSLAAQKSIDFGMVIRTPMIEIQTIGAGGGSLARVDASGLLQVGPESAGAQPGPVCYGLRDALDPLGPTLTDANLLLGRINAARPIGGQLAQLDVDAARRAIAHFVAEPLGIEVLAAAEAILTVANARMAGAIRLVSIERGHDPKRFAYMPFGGGGALHVCAMMREVGVSQGLVPRYPGVSSALGCAIADMRHDFVRTLNRPLSQIDSMALANDIASFLRQGGEQLASAGVHFIATRVAAELDMLYQGQTHSIAVAVPGGEGNWRTDAASLSAAFEQAYRAAYGQVLQSVALRVLNLRVTVIGERAKFDLRLLAPVGSVADGGPALPPREHRPVRHQGAWHPVPVFDRLDLPVAARITGPALFEQPDTTVWLEPGFAARVDHLGNLVIEPDTRSGQP